MGETGGCGSLLEAHLIETPSNEYQFANRERTHILLQVVGVGLLLSTLACLYSL